MEVVEGDGVGLEALVGHVAEEFFDVGDVGLGCVGGHAFFEHEVGFVIIE